MPANIQQQESRATARTNIKVIGIQVDPPMLSIFETGMPENHRPPQTTSEMLEKLQTIPGLAGKLQDTPQNTARLAAKLQNNTVCVFFVLTFVKQA